MNKLFIFFTIATLFLILAIFAISATDTGAAAPPPPIQEYVYAQTLAANPEIIGIGDNVVFVTQTGGANKAPAQMMVGKKVIVTSPFVFFDEIPPCCVCVNTCCDCSSCGAITPIPPTFTPLPPTITVPAITPTQPGTTQTPGVFKCPNPVTRIRPVVPGVSVASKYISACTVTGKFYRADGTAILLTNAHCVTRPTPKGAPGYTIGTNDPVYQPGPADGGTAADTIGTVYYWYPNAPVSGQTYWYDAGAVKLTNDGFMDAKVCNFAAPARTAEPVKDMAIEKFGRTTGHTTGLIFETNACVRVYSSQSIFYVFCDQHIITSTTPGRDFMAGGDSGSYIYVKGDPSTGVLLGFAGNDEYAIGSRFSRVMRGMGLLFNKP